MKWNSIEDIISHFNLDVDKTDISSVHTELVRLLAELYAEKKGGEFSTEEQTQRYDDIKKAIEDLKMFGSQHNALFSLNQVADIIKAVTKAISPQKETLKPDIKLQLKSELQTKIKNFYKPYKIISAIIVLFCTVFIIFSKTLSKVSFLAPLFGHLHLSSIMVYILFISTTWFLFIWFKEKRDEQREEWLFSEDSKFVILSEVVSSFGKKLENKVVFSFRDFVRAIQGKKKKRSSSLIKIYLSLIYRILYGASIIDVGLAEQLASHHLTDLENKNIIRKYDMKSIELCYEIDDDVIRQLPERFYYRYYY